MPNRLQARRKRASAILIAGAVAIAATMGVLIAIFITSQAASARLLARVESARADSHAAFAVLEAVSGVETRYRGVLTSTDARAQTRFDEAVSETATALDWFKSRADADPALTASGAAAIARVRERVDYCAQVVTLAHAGRVQEVRAMILSARTSETSSAARTALFDFVEAAEERSTNLTRQALEQRSVSDRLALALALVAAAACAVTGWAVVRERRSWASAYRLSEEANAALTRANAEARASDAAKTRFLAVASHDLRQPLHALSLYLSALRRRVSSQELLRIVGNMERATESMTHMFASLLDLARIQSGIVNSRIEAFPLQANFERIAAEFAPQPVEVDPTTLAIRADMRALDGILRNLVSNALKHGGGWARIEARVQQDKVLVCVVDKGPGIPPDKVNDIFEEFTRLDGSKSEGLGIGLTIVKRTAERLGYKVVVESTPGQGALFGVLAPLARAAEGESAAEANVALPPNVLQGVRVIVIDDEPLPLSASTQILRDAGAEAEPASSVAALDSLLDKAAFPDVLVMDLRLDGKLAGVAAARAARARSPYAMAAIIVTGDTAPETLQFLQESGFSWLTKPVSPTELTGAVAIAASMAWGPLASGAFNVLEGRLPPRPRDLSSPRLV